MNVWSNYKAGSKTNKVLKRRCKKYCRRLKKKGYSNFEVAIYRSYATIDCTTQEGHQTLFVDYCVDRCIDRSGNEV